VAHQATQTQEAALDELPSEIFFLFILRLLERRQLFSNGPGAGWQGFSSSILRSIRSVFGIYGSISDESGVMICGQASICYRNLSLTTVPFFGDAMGTTVCDDGCSKAGGTYMTKCSMEAGHPGKL
jgi:hypothetical protein